MGLTNPFTYMAILKGTKMTLAPISFPPDGWQLRGEKKKEQLTKSWHLGGNKGGLEPGIYNGMEYWV